MKHWLLICLVSLASLANLHAMENGPDPMWEDLLNPEAQIEKTKHDIHKNKFLTYFGLRYRLIYRPKDKPLPIKKKKRFFRRTKPELFPTYHRIIETRKKIQREKIQRKEINIPPLNQTENYMKKKLEARQKNRDETRFKRLLKQYNSGQ